MQCKLRNLRKWKIRLKSTSNYICFRFRIQSSSIALINVIISAAIEFGIFKTRTISTKKCTFQCKDFRNRSFTDWSLRIRNNCFILIIYSIAMSRNINPSQTHFPNATTTDHQMLLFVSFSA